MRGCDVLRNHTPADCGEEWGAFAEALRLRRAGSRRSWLILASGFGKTIGLKCRGVCPNGLFGSADLRCFRRYGFASMVAAAGCVTGTEREMTDAMLGNPLELCGAEASDGASIYRDF